MKFRLPDNSRLLGLCGSVAPETGESTGFFKGLAARLVVKSVPPLFSVSSFVHCFEFIFECYTRSKQVQHATCMLHYSASRHFLSV